MSRTRVCVSAVLLLIAWSVLAFGGVYEWAYAPVLVAAPLLGVWAGYLARRRGSPSVFASRRLGGALLLLAAAVSVQLIPLPRGVLSVASPALVRVLNQVHLLFAQGMTGHALTINPRATAVALAFVLGLTALLLGLASLLRIVGARRLTGGIVVLALIVAVAAIVQFAFGDHRIYGFWTPVFGREPFGPFVNRNHFAGWMVMAMSVSLGYLAGRVESAIAVAGPSWRNKLIWWSTPAASRMVMLAVGIAVMGASVVLTRSRSGAAAVLIALVLFAIAGVRGRAGIARRLVMLALLAVLSAGMVVWGNADALGQRFTKAEWLEPTGRWGAWQDTIRVSRDFWLTGTGLNTFGDVMLVYQRRPGLHLVHAHSDYLQLVSEGGVLLGIPILLSVFVFVREVRRRFRQGADDPMTAWLRCGACIGIAAIALQEAVEGSLQMPGNAVLFTVLAAIAIHKAPSGARPAQPEVRVTQESAGAR